jgi:Flagellar hook-length control protein FliK
VHVAPGEPPLPWRVEIRDAPDHDERQEEAVTATVFVDLPDTGPVEARLALAAGRLRVHFVVASDEVREQLLAHADELTAALSSAGFTGVELAAHADPGRLARDRATDEVPRDRPRAGGLLDIRA